MQRIARLLSAAAVVVTLGTLLTSVASALPKKPNIILVMTDDQGYGELGCHGNPILKTPNLDKFHDQSVRFTDFHVSPTCSPTRCSLMTGRHEFRSGVTHTIYERERMSLEATTFVQLLKQAGYTTGIFGKWHLGDEDEYQPGKRGFDEVFIHGAGGIGQSYVGSCGDAPGNTYFDPAILHNGKFERTEGFCTDVFFGQATKWIDAKRQEDKPFFAYITPNAPHAPYIAPEKYAAMYRGKDLDKDAVNYYGMITNIDDNFGALMAKLSEWKMDENTLVIFMTDNGHSIARLYNAGMHGAKASPYEGGNRVPSFWRWTGTLPAGKDVKKLTAHVDYFATFCELAGVPVPSDLKLDGRSLVPLLTDADAPWAERQLFVHRGRWPKGEPDSMKHELCAIRTARWRLVNNKELYDITADPGETVNVIDKHPEVVAALRSAYDQWWDEVIPATRFNDNAELPEINPFKERYWKQVGKPKGK
jgi:arylsulfatase